MVFSRLLLHRGPAVAGIYVEIAAGTFLCISGTGHPVQAQDTVAQPPRPAGRTGRQETVKQIADRLSQTTRIRVVADSALGRQLLSAPEDAVTPATLEEYLTRLTRRLPPGTMWLKVYLPPTSDSRRFQPDAVAQLARAQMELLGRPAPNTVQIQGKVLSVTEAEPVIRTLGLEPVYVLTGRQAALNPGGLGGGSSNAVMDALTKQLGVANVTDIPNGTYKVTIPGADGSPQQATVEVDSSDGRRRISVRVGNTPEQ
jgi:hypothetical protein